MVLQVELVNIIWNIIKYRKTESRIEIHAFYKQRFFSTQPQWCLFFSWIELQILLRCCLIHISIIIVRHFSHVLYLCSCLDLGLFISYLCFIFTFVFIMINRIISLIQKNWSFCLFFTRCTIILDNNVGSSVFCSIVCQFQPGVAYWTVAYKKGV